MKDYHTHVPSPHGGYLCSVTREDWESVARANGMTPCFGVHPWHAHEVNAAEVAFDLDDWLSRYPEADVGESGLDGSGRHRETMAAQELLLHVHLGAAFRHSRMIHLHGTHAWGRLLEILRARVRSSTLPRFLLHAWNGSHELAREFLALGGIFSVGWRELSHPKAEERYARIPADKLFPETDGHPERWAATLALLRLLQSGLS